MVVVGMMVVVVVVVQGLSDATMCNILSFLEAEICNESLFHFRRNMLYTRLMK